MGLSTTHFFPRIIFSYVSHLFHAQTVCVAEKSVASTPADCCYAWQSSAPTPYADYCEDTLRFCNDTFSGFKEYLLNEQIVAPDGNRNFQNRTKVMNIKISLLQFISAHMLALMSHFNLLVSCCFLPQYRESNREREREKQTDREPVSLIRPTDTHEFVRHSTASILIEFDELIANQNG